MCGRVIQSSGPLRLAIVEGLNVSDSRLANVPRRYNAAPSQELLVIRRTIRRVNAHSTSSSGVNPALVRRREGWSEAHQREGFLIN